MCARNISYPLVSQGMPKNQVREKVAEVARILGIENILDRPSVVCRAATASASRWAGRSCASPKAS